MNEADIEPTPLHTVDQLCRMADATVRRVRAAGKCGDAEAEGRFWERYDEIMVCLSMQEPKTLLECGQICSVAGSLMMARAEGVEVGAGYNELQMLAHCHGNYLHLLHCEFESQANQEACQPDGASLQHQEANDNGAEVPAS